MYLTKEPFLFPRIFRESLRKSLLCSQSWYAGYKLHDAGWERPGGCGVLLEGNCIILNHIYTANGSIKQSCWLIYAATGDLLNRQKLLPWSQNKQNWVGPIYFEHHHIMNSSTFHEDRDQSGHLVTTIPSRANAPCPVLNHLLFPNEQFIL